MYISYQGWTNTGCQVARPIKFFSVAFNIFEYGTWSLLSIWRLVFCGGSYIFGKRVHTCFLLQRFDRKKSNSIWILLPDKRFLTPRLWNLAVNLPRAAIVTDVSTKCSEGDIVQFRIWKLYSGEKSASFSSDKSNLKMETTNLRETLVSIYENT
jgi:hypothetical protein